jgi:four helix bundle protein
MQDFRKLVVWQRAHALTKAIFRMASQIPGRQRFILSDQICRASSSVPTNIVEGTTRSSDRETARFLEIAASSAAETEYHLELIIDLELFPISELKAMQQEVVEIRKMLNAFIGRLRGPKPPPTV